MSLFDPDRSAERVPVSLVTGFLGSGKTTLLNRLLRHPGMADSAVIINEFGAVGLDHLLVERLDGEVAVLANGCICCTVRSDLEETLRLLLARRDAGEVPPFARVLVESTGLADPAPILQLLLNNPLVGRFVRLDAVVATVDAANGMRQLDEHATAVKQVALADRLLVTKPDLADPVPLEERLRALNPAAPIARVAHGEIAPGLLFGAGPVDPAARTADARRWLNEAAYEGESHAAGIRAFCLAFAAPLDWMAVNRWLTAIRTERGDDLLRVKGILNLRDEDGPVVIHGVHHIFHPPVRLEAWPDDDRRSRIVFITRDLALHELKAAFALVAGGSFAEAG